MQVNIGKELVSPDGKKVIYDNVTPAIIEAVRTNDSKQNKLAFIDRMLDKQELEIATLRYVIIDVLSSIAGTEQAEIKQQAGDIIAKVYDKDSVDLSLEEIIFIKDRIGMVQNVATMWAANNILEGKESDK